MLKEQTPLVESSFDFLLPIGWSEVVAAEVSVVGERGRSYSMAMLSGVQLRWVEVLLPPGDFRPLEPVPRAEGRAPGPRTMPEPWWWWWRWR